MLSHSTPHYWLLSCLIALVALGTQPLCGAKVIVAERWAEGNVPDENPTEDEQETQADEGTPLRRRTCVLPAVRAQFVGIKIGSSPPTCTFLLSAPPRFDGELDARNGLGGPLRL